VCLFATATVLELPPIRISRVTDVVPMQPMQLVRPSDASACPKQSSQAVGSRRSLCSQRGCSPAVAAVAGDDDAMLIGERNDLHHVVSAEFVGIVPTCLSTSAWSRTIARRSRRSIARAPPGRAAAFAWRELLEPRRRFERNDARGERRAHRARVVPWRLVEVAVVGLSARAAPLDVDGQHERVGVASSCLPASRVNQLTLLADRDF
jgi:hypothetical protein